MAFKTQILAEDGTALDLRDITKGAVLRIVMPNGVEITTVAKRSYADRVTSVRAAREDFDATKSARMAAAKVRIDERRAAKAEARQAWRASTAEVVPLTRAELHAHRSAKRASTMLAKKVGKP